MAVTEHVVRATNLTEVSAGEWMMFVTTSGAGMALNVLCLPVIRDLFGHAHELYFRVKYDDETNVMHFLDFAAVDEWSAAC